MFLVQGMSSQNSNDFTSQKSSQNVVYWIGSQVERGRDGTGRRGQLRESATLGDGRAMHSNCLMRQNSAVLVDIVALVSSFLTARQEVQWITVVRSRLVSGRCDHYKHHFYSIEGIKQSDSVTIGETILWLFCQFPMPACPILYCSLIWFSAVFDFMTMFHEKQ